MEESVNFTDNLLIEGNNSVNTTKAMKTTLLLAIVLFSITAYSQDTTALVKQIDSLVYLINNSSFKPQRDTLKQEQPKIGLSMQTYLTMLTDGNEVKKYINNVHMTMKENGVTKKVNATNTFYYDHNKLIKVEEIATEGSNKKLEASWYYANDKPLYSTLKSDKSEERGEFLLKIAKAMLEKMNFKSNL